MVICRTFFRSFNSFPFICVGIKSFEMVHLFSSFCRKDVKQNGVISKSEAYVAIPQMVLEFYENNREWTELYCD